MIKNNRGSDRFSEYLEALKSLPFIGYHKNGQRNFWAVDPVEDVVEGNRIGVDHAFEFIKLLAKYGDVGSSPLTHVVLDMEKSPETTSQKIGFLETLNSVVAIGARHTDIERYYKAKDAAKRGHDNRNVVFLNARKRRSENDKK